MSLIAKLRRIVLWSMLAVGSLFGGPMNPREIEDLMRLMNQTLMEFVVTDHQGDDDFPRWRQDQRDHPS